MRWGSVDYRQLQKLRDNLAKLESVDMDKFCRDMSKELAASKRYANRRDLIRALLDSGKRYTLDEVDRLIESYMKGQVK